MGSVLVYCYLCLVFIGGVYLSVLRDGGRVWKSSSNVPTLHGPGFDCDSAFGEENPSLETLLLCNKTSSGPGFNKTEIQSLNTEIIRLEEGQCEQFQQEGFRWDTFQVWLEIWRKIVKTDRLKIL